MPYALTILQELDKMHIKALAELLKITLNFNTIKNFSQRYKIKIHILPVFILPKSVYASYVIEIRRRQLKL
jgi:hypothetical protein